MKETFLSRFVNTENIYTYILEVWTTLIESEYANEFTNM